MIPVHPSTITGTSPSFNGGGDCGPKGPNQALGSSWGTYNPSLMTYTFWSYVPSGNFLKYHPFPWSS